MKKLLLFIFALYCGQSIFSQAIPELLYYRFEETGTTVTNFASAPPPGTATATIMGSITQNTDSICNGALVGSGISSTTDYLNTNWAPNLGNGSWTISFRTSGISANSTLYYIFGDVGTTSFRCFTNGVAGANNWIIRGAGLTDTYINGGALSTPTMCTFVYDNTLNNLRGYLNGVLVTTVAQGAPNLTGTGPLKVMGYGTNIGAPAGGLLDEFRLYNRALSASEIAELYNPVISNFVVANSYICEGDSVNLIVPASISGSILWNTGSTNDTLLINTPDTFSVSVSGTCGSGSDTIVVVSGTTTSSIASASCDTFVSPSGMNLTSTGMYMDTIPNVVGCDSVITINLTINTPTVFIVASDTAVCEGQSTMLTLSGADTYTWDGNPITSSTYAPSSSVMIDVIGLDTITGCSAMDSVFITLNPLPTVSFTSSIDTVCVTSGVATLSGGSPSGGVYSGPGVSGTNFNPTTAGIGIHNIIYTYTDAESCENSDTSRITVIGCAGLQDNFVWSIDVFPNPTTDIVNVTMNTVKENLRIEIINSLGQKVNEFKFENVNSVVIPMSESNGVYFIKLTDENNNSIQRRVIKK